MEKGTNICMSEADIKVSMASLASSHVEIFLLFSLQKEPTSIIATLERK